MRFPFQIALSMVLLAGCTPRGSVGEDRPVIPLQALNRPASEITKIIDGSRSPDGKWAVAVGFRDGTVPEWGELKYDDPPRSSFYLYPDKDAANYLIDLRCERIVALMDSDHHGTSSTYNREYVDFYWSPDSRWLVEVHGWRWETSQATVWSVGDGRRMAAESLLPHAQRALEECYANHRPAITDWDLGQYALEADVDGISNDGVIRVKVYGQVPKQEAPDLLTEITLKATEGIVFLQRAQTTKD